MPCWYYGKKELQNTPSIQDGLDYETECRYRKEGARFIIDTGTKMDLGCNTMATGVVYFHRFYMFHSFKNFPRYVTACCCLLLAGKVEETPKKCKDIIRTAKTILTERKFLTFGEDPKEEVMTLERILLQTIKFDLQVEHPYGYLLKYAKCLEGDKTKLQKVVQMAWTFVNDSLCTTLSLQWEPDIVAIALMYLAGKLSKFEVVDWNGRQPKHLRWWDMFVEDVTMDLLEDICAQVLDLYSQSNSISLPNPPPLLPIDDPSRERINPPLPTVSASNTSNETPGKSGKTETTAISTNDCSSAKNVYSITPVEASVRFPSYPVDFATNTNYLPVFPPTNTSVPPPPINPINHVMSTMQHMGSSSSNCLAPPTLTSIQPPLQQYQYPTTASHFSNQNQVSSSNAKRTYYLPLP